MSVFIPMPDTNQTQKILILIVKTENYDT